MPPKLYRYQPLTDYALSALHGRYLWFSRPAVFDDPFDCNFRLDTIEPTNDDYIRVAERFAESLPDDVLSAVRSGSLPAELREAIQDVVRRAFALRVEVNREQRGVCCFSEVPDSTIMWSLYAERHRGFVLEFDTDQHPFSKALPVHYCSTKPSVNPLHALLDNSGEEWLTMVLSKADCWSYQREWRIMNRDGGNRSVPFSEHSLTGIYLGLATPDDIANQIVALPHAAAASVYRMTPHPEALSLRVVPLRRPG